MDKQLARWRRGAAARLKAQRRALIHMHEGTYHAKGGRDFHHLTACGLKLGRNSRPYALTDPSRWKRMTCKRCRACKVADPKPLRLRRRV